MQNKLSTFGITFDDVLLEPRYQQRRALRSRRHARG